MSYLDSKDVHFPCSRLGVHSPGKYPFSSEKFGEAVASRGLDKGLIRFSLLTSEKLNLCKGHDCNNNDMLNP